MDIRKLDLNLLKVLAAMLESNSVSATGRLIGSSQPAVSAALNKLRLAFRDDLFIRTGKGMRPTPFAVALKAPLQRILDEITRDLLRPSEFDPTTSDRRFTISTSDIGEMVFLPRLLEMLRAEAPGTTARTVALPHAHLEQALERGDIDVALGYFPDLDGPNIRSERLFEHPFVCLVRSSHPTIGDSLTLKQFLAADHLVVNQDGRSQEIFERHMTSLRLSRRIQLHLPHFMSVPLLVAQSDLISTVPLILGVTAARTGGVRYLPPPLSIPSIPLRLYWHRRMDGETAVAWLRGRITVAFLDNDPFPPN